MSTQTIAQYLASRELQRRGLKEYAARKTAIAKRDAARNKPPPAPLLLTSRGADARARGERTRALRRMVVAGMPLEEATRRLAARRRRSAHAH